MKLAIKVVAAVRQPLRREWRPSLGLDAHELYLLLLLQLRTEKLSVKTV